MVNNGKQFEKNFKNSVDKLGIFLFRLRDTATSYYGGNDFLRFSNTNPCDFFMFYNNGKENRLALLELKATKGKSLPFGNIKQHQLVELRKYGNYEGVRALFVVYFSDLEKCFSIDARKVDDFVSNSARKSIPVDFLREMGDEIEVSSLKVNQRFNIDKWIKDSL